MKLAKTLEGSKHRGVHSHEHPLQPEGKSSCPCMCWPPGRGIFPRPRRRNGIIPSLGAFAPALFSDERESERLWLCSADMAPSDREGFHRHPGEQLTFHRKASQNGAAQQQLLGLHLTTPSVYREGGDTPLHGVWRPPCPCRAAERPLHCAAACWREFGLKGVNSSLL